ncbi:DUF2779 domain-containing protein [Roseateles cellulosilyticus]|uniref:DUF2779 domain-containing protein n=1 Tax=Pelomonas cellulosilytica TaxID=2906762 RepID=A0ABS8XVV4_9BURK|nr:DUF2779 domain-containing protein [Pelomonas sp. P8]MCE4556794.1 DUF2779 domain-containing protein [Pelomonas sp. P8]
MTVPRALLDDDDVRHWRACARRFWLRRHSGTAPQPQDEDEPAADPAPGQPPRVPGVDRLVEGPGRAQALRASFPGLVSLAAPQDEAGWQQAVQATREHLAATELQGEAWALQGACLEWRGPGLPVRVRVDLITRGGAGFRIFRLRHATAGTEADVDAVALWWHVALKAGLRVQAGGLLLVDTGFVYPGHGLYAGLYREVDVGPSVGDRPVDDWLAALQQCDAGPQPPIPLGAPCGQRCEMMAACALPTPSLQVVSAEASLDIVGRELAAELRAEGHASLHTVPLQRLAAGRHRRAAQAVQWGCPVMEGDARAALRVVPGPRRWLRFETVGFAVPPWAGTQPYQILPFQWSCDAESPGGFIQHMDYLAGPDADPRRDFALSLMEHLGDHGPLLAYNAGFERNRLRELALRFDDLRPALEALAARIVDLFVLLREHYYHPAMAGSWSARSVFAAAVPQYGAHHFACAWRGQLLESPLQAFAAVQHKSVSVAERRAVFDSLRAHGRRHCAALRGLTRLLEDEASD